MTRKDYQLIAAAIRTVHEYTQQGRMKHHDAAVLRSIVTSLCSALKTDNYNFDREKFMKACTDR